MRLLLILTPVLIAGIIWGNSSPAFQRDEVCQLDDVSGKGIDSKELEPGCVGTSDDIDETFAQQHKYPHRYSRVIYENGQTEIEAMKNIPSPIEFAGFHNPGDDKPIIEMSKALTNTCSIFQKKLLSILRELVHESSMKLDGNPTLSARIQSYTNVSEIVADGILKLVNFSPLIVNEESRREAARQLFEKFSSMLVNIEDVEHDLDVYLKFKNKTKEDEEIENMIQRLKYLKTQFALQIEN